MYVYIYIYIYLYIYVHIYTYVIIDVQVPQLKTAALNLIASFTGIATVLCRFSTIATRTFLFM